MQNSLSQRVPTTCFHPIAGERRHLQPGVGSAHSENLAFVWEGPHKQEVKSLGRRL